MINPFSEIYRVCNRGSNEEKYRLIRSGILTLPRYLDVELTNCCNFKCCFCPTGTHSMVRPRGYMPESVLDALTENVAKYHIPGVRLIRWGEPTLYPSLLPAIRRFREAGACVHINTNGWKLDETLIRGLLDVHLDSIKISFQGADEGTYNEMRSGGDYARLLRSLKSLYEWRGDRTYPFIQVSTTLTEETDDQVEAFKRDVAPWCDYYNIGYTKLKHLNVEAMKIEEARKETVRRLQEKEHIRRKYLKTCNEAFDKLSVNWNGDVTLCCSDYDNFMLVGNIMDMDLREIFNSKAADFYRQMIVKGEHFRQIKCCSECYEIMPVTV